MNNGKYIVCRNNVYIGEVVKAYNIYRYAGKYNFLSIKSGQLTTSSWRSFRSMLFVPNENKLSNDLLYNSPNYPILNVSDDEMCLNLEPNSIIIKDACNLDALLEYFGFKKDLTLEDIIKIRKTFFTGRFAKDNCELFGWKEIMAEDLIFRNNGEEITSYVEIERRKRMHRLEQQAGHRMFYGVNESPLPREYWDVLDARGDNTLMDVINGRDNKMNAFTPHIQEGFVKKLKRL